MGKTFAGIAIGWAMSLLLFVLWTDETKSAPRAVVLVPATAIENPAIENPAIDMQGFLEAAAAAANHRESHRVSEAEFLRMSREPGTIVLDARSRAKFDELHIRGAINLSFSDISIPTSKTTLPDKSARILIYCNNNFANAPVAFMPKLPTASLNLSTYITLYDYGYRNVYELGPLLDVDHTVLPLEATHR